MKLTLTNGPEIFLYVFHVCDTWSSMVHVGWVAVWYTQSPPVRGAHWSSGGGGFRRHIYFTLGPQWFMWGGLLDATHVLHQQKFHTGPQGVGFRQHIYFSDFVHNGSCGVCCWMINFHSIGGHRGFEGWLGMYFLEGAH